MERRQFLHLTAFGSGLWFVARRAAAGPLPEKNVAGSIYYTADAPGRWATKVKTHLPVIEVKRSEGKSEVQIVTPHEMKGYEHFIVKHILFDSQLRFLNERIFDPAKDTSPVSTFQLGDYKGIIFALSVCNLHDSWLNSAEV